MKNTLIAIMGVVLLAFGYVVMISFSGTKPAVVADYKDAEYMIDGYPVQLTDGTSEVPNAPGSASMVTTQYFGNEVRGDFDNDGDEDVAFVLTQSGGGTGTYFYLVGARKGADGYRGTAGFRIGDRIAPQTTEFRDGLVVVNYADRKPDEPMAAQPTVGTTLYLKYDATSDAFNTITPDSGEGAPVPTRISLKMGERKTLSNLAITPLSLVSDSRCPHDVTCVWAGTVELRVKITNGTDGREMVLKLNEAVSVDAYTITLVDAVPYPSGGKTAADAYSFVVQVLKQ